jgi:ABC-type enterobactin transport system permease subunit
MVVLWPLLVLALIVFSDKSVENVVLAALAGAVGTALAVGLTNATPRAKRKRAEARARRAGA